MTISIILSPETAVAAANLLSIDDDKSRGSAFRISDGVTNFLVTAKHVVFNAKGDLHGHTAIVCAYDPMAIELDPMIIRIDLREAVVRKSPTHDVVAIELGDEVNVDKLNEKYETKLRPYASIVRRGVTGTYPVSMASTKIMSGISLGDSAYLAGYPTSLGMRDQDYYDFSRPLLRGGVVAGKNTKRRTFVVDCPSYPGNSGSPIVVRTQGGEHYVAGVVSQYIPFETRWHSNREKIFNTEISNSGYTVCVSMDVVLELLEYSQLEGANKRHREVSYKS